jgi:hypothetical protein
MTRINVGVDPMELCDKHLTAEYRELPRVFNHKPKGFVPDRFKLGTGHVNWCAQYQLSLVKRQIKICEEMRVRGFKVNYPVKITDEVGEWLESDELYARVIVRSRILDRMPGNPKWTNRIRPIWSVFE